MKTLMRFNKLSIVPLTSTVLGIVDLVIFVWDLQLFYIGLIGSLTLITGIGLFLHKDWLHRGALLLAPLNFMIGVSTLFSSIYLFGFDSGFQIILLDLGLLVFSIIPFILFVYLITRKETLID